MLKRINDALPGLVFGIVFYGIVVQLIGVWFVTDKISYSIGLWYGIAIAVGIAVNIATVIYDATAIYGQKDADFMIHGIFSIKVFGQEVWITTSHACILIVMAIMVIFAIVANRKLKKAKEVPDGFQNIIELIVEMLDKMVEGTMGKWAPRFVNYISTIFIFILMSNISGLFGLRPPTADYGTTLALAHFS